jgi:hypothetical protein
MVVICKYIDGQNQFSFLSPVILPRWILLFFCFYSLEMKTNTFVIQPKVHDAVLFFLFLLYVMLLRDCFTISRASKKELTAYVVTLQGEKYLFAF